MSKRLSDHSSTYLERTIFQINTTVISIRVESFIINVSNFVVVTNILDLRKRNLVVKEARTRAAETSIFKNLNVAQKSSCWVLGEVDFRLTWLQAVEIKLEVVN